MNFGKYKDLFTNKYPLIVGLSISFSLFFILLTAISETFNFLMLSVIFMSIALLITLIVLRFNKFSFSLILIASCLLFFQFYVWMFAEIEPWGGTWDYIFCYIFLPTGLIFLWWGILHGHKTINKNLRIYNVIFTSLMALFMIYVLYYAFFVKPDELNEKTYLIPLILISIFCTIAIESSEYSMKYLKQGFQSISKAAMARDKFIDFKFITIFRMLFCLLTILTILMPWTYGPERDSGMGEMYNPYHRTPASVCTGYDFIVGCNPIYEVAVFIQTPYLLLAPIILMVSLFFMFLQKERYVIISMAVNLFAAFPVIVWWFDILHQVPISYAHDIFLTYGYVAFYILIIANLIIGLITLKYSEIEDIQKVQ